MQIFCLLPLLILPLSSATTTNAAAAETTTFAECAETIGPTKVECGVAAKDEASCRDQVRPCYGRCFS